MIPLKLLAFVLLVMHIASAVYIFTVLRKQARLLMLPIDTYLKHFRMALFALSAAIFVGNIIPIVIDVLTLLVPINRPVSVSFVSLAYALSNALTALVSAYLIHMLYRLAANEKQITDYTQHSLETELKTSQGKEK